MVSEPRLKNWVQAALGGLLLIVVFLTILLSG